MSRKAFFFTITTTILQLLVLSCGNRSKGENPLLLSALSLAGRSASSSESLYCKSAATAAAYSASGASVMQGMQTNNGALTISREKVQYNAGTVLVKYRSSSAINSKVLNSFSMAGTVARALHSDSDGSVWMRYRLKPGLSVEDSVKSLHGQPGILTVQPDYVYHSTALPNDPNFSTNIPNQWDLYSTTYKDMDIVPVWITDGLTDCSGITVAVVDSGVNYNHSDISTNMWNGSSVTCPSGATAIHGCDFVDNDNDPMDRNGHGTHVAGTIGAIGNNSTGIAGICWKANIMAVRVLDATGSGSTSSIAQGIDFAVNNGAKVINASWGGNMYDQLMYDAMVYARANGVLVATAAGNSSTNNDVSAVYPASFGLDNIIAVGATAQDGSLASFSNCGDKTVGIAAPGVSIYSLFPVTTTYATPSWSFAGNPANWISETVSGYPGLSDPSGFGVAYSDNWNTTAYTTITPTASADLINLEFYLYYDLELNKDYVKIVYNQTGGQPSLSTGSLDSITGSSGYYMYYKGYTLPFSAASGSPYSVGFQMITDGSGTADGVFINDFKVSEISFGTTGYGLDSGTSMATPHVAGLAALLMQYAKNNSKNCSYKDIISSIETGGVHDTLLDGLILNGKRLDAAGSLSVLKAGCAL